jgi:L-alanine-DL-glutamate epimerase-like enolase superfamily enzyme
MQVKFRSFQLKFKYPFTISKGTKTHQPTFVVALEHMGKTGYGEAPAIAYYNTTTDKMEADLAAKKHFIEKFAFTDPGRYWHFLHHLFPSNPFLVCALDIAAWDLYGKLRNTPAFKLMGAENLLGPETDYTIGIDTIENMVGKMNEKPWPIYKIKLGTTHDIEIMTELRKHTNSIFRIDANAAWKAGEALEKINIFKDLGVEFVEQPLAKDDWEGMKWLYDKSPLPLIADESCVKEADVATCENHFHGINIKLTKCSGITPALRMIRDARKRNMKLMIGCMNECTIGSAPIAHLRALVDYIDMDGPLLLAEDLATGLIFEDTDIKVSPLPGFGISPYPNLFAE